MKKLLLLSAFIGCTTAAVAQKNCREVKDKKDSFTGKAVRQARFGIGGLFTRWLAELDQRDGQTTMKWSIAVPGEFNVAFPQGTLMLFKLKDGTVLKLGTTEQTAPITQVAGQNIFTQYSLLFNLSKEELEHFSQSYIEDMKVDVPGMTIKNPSIKDSQMGPIARACQCLLATAS